MQNVPSEVSFFFLLATLIKKKKETNSKKRKSIGDTLEKFHAKCSLRSKEQKDGHRYMPIFLPEAAELPRTPEKEKLCFRETILRRNYISCECSFFLTSLGTPEKEKLR